MPDSRVGKNSEFDIDKLFDDAGKSISSAEDFWKAVSQEVAKATKELKESKSVLGELIKSEKEITELELERQSLDKKKKALNILIEKQQDKSLKLDEKKLKLLKDQQKVLEKEIKITQAKQKAQETLDKFEQARTDKQARDIEKEAVKENQKLAQDLLKEGYLSKENIKTALTGGLDGTAGIVKGLDTLTSGLADLSKKLDKGIEEIAKYKSDWDTRLFGSGSNHTNLTDAISKAVGPSPFVKQQDLMKNIDAAVEKGIAYDIEQRAFLETIKDDIAGTFDAFDSTLLQIIRVQQSDTTAARLGMEAALNKYLNTMYKNTEYLSGTSDTVTQALYEATSLLGPDKSIGFEYQVQKWLGSLYSVGMSQGSISSIAQALGKMASGDISGTTSDAGKLLVMAASKSGIPYSELLTKGINESDINKLMESMVGYLQEIANSNKVVQSKYASIYGLSTSDIIAAGNLGNTLKEISKSGLSYGSALGVLQDMSRSIGSRMSTGELMNNVIDNLQYTLSQGIASNPALYGLWTMSNMLDDLVGGINIPAISVMGNMVDLETTIADLTRVGALGASLLGSVGNMISGLSNQGQGAWGMLTALGLSDKLTKITRGTGLSTGIKETQSGYNYAGNTNGNDVYDSSIASADDQKTELAVAAEEENNDIKLSDLNQSVLRIYELLATVISAGSLAVRLEDNFAWSKTI